MPSLSSLLSWMNIQWFTGISALWGSSWVLAVISSSRPYAVLLDTSEISNRMESLMCDWPDDKAWKSRQMLVCFAMIDDNFLASLESNSWSVTEVLCWASGSQQAYTPVLVNSSVVCVWSDCLSVRLSIAGQSPPVHAQIWFTDLWAGLNFLNESQIESDFRFWKQQQPWTFEYWQLGDWSCYCHCSYSSWLRWEWGWRAFCLREDEMTLTWFVMQLAVFHDPHYWLCWECSYVDSLVGPIQGIVLSSSRFHWKGMAPVDLKIPAGTVLMANQKKL